MRPDTVTRNDAPVYDATRAAWYDEHHRKNLRTRLTTWRERNLLARALATLGPLGSILDAPCGSGRFFPVLTTVRDATLTGADNSAEMLDVAARSDSARMHGVRLVNTSLFATSFADREFDCVVCMRFLHHLSMDTDRRTVLAEIRRISRRWAIVSLWVDGNWQARNRRQRPPTAGFGRRNWIARDVIERELTQSGFSIVRHYDVAPMLSMWRLYVLERS